MRFCLFILLAIGLYVFPYSPVFGEDAAMALDACPAPVETHIRTTSDVGFCDLYARQLAYRTNRIAYRQEIDARRKHFIRPSIEARRKYDKDLRAMYEKDAAGEDAGLSGN